MTIGLPAIPSAQSGDDVLDKVNAMIARLNALSGALVASGLLTTSHGAIVGLSAPSDAPTVAAPAVIEAVKLDGASVGPGPAPELANRWTYDARRIRAPGSALLSDAAPRYGRPVAGAEARIHPAAVGDLCLIVVIPRLPAERVSELWVLTEIIARTGCRPP